ncbi:MAG: tyrosine-type recombinase/integrase [bacterium]
MACFYKRGKTWTFSMDIGKDEFGRRKKKAVGGFRTKKEAEEAAARMKVELAKGIYIEEKNITFKAFAEEWLKLYSPTVKLTTYRFRIFALNVLFKYFAARKLPDIKKLELQKVINELQAQYSKSSLQAILSCLNLIFKKALELEIISTNPMQFVKMQRIVDDEKETEVKYLEKDEAELFLKHCHDSEHYPFFLLLIYTGMRIGEAQALKWDDVNFVNNTISINKTLYVPKKIEDYILQTPKTKRSKRTIAVSEIVLSELKKHKQRQNIKRLQCDNWYDGNFIFTSPKFSGYPSCYSLYNLAMKNILQAAGINKKLTPHSLRHTHTSLLAQAGVSLEEIMERLGHENDRITRSVYLHITKDMKKESVKKFDLLMQK